MKEEGRRIFFILFSMIFATSGFCDPFLVILVDARHLDYSSTKGFFKTLTKHPSNGSKNGDVGHAWIYLEGEINGQPYILEGGHSGELGEIQPKYFDGVLAASARSEADPIQYLWESQRDGFFQRGNGNHDPTFAAKIPLTEEQFKQILQFVHHYDYADYAITRKQCSSFVSHVALIAGLRLACEQNMAIEQDVFICGEKIRLWENPVYSEITFSTPDVLEKSLQEAVAQGHVEDALEWYLKNHPRPFKDKLKENWLDLIRFPGRLFRWLLI
jgi:hypothetical protein